MKDRRMDSWSNGGGVERWRVERDSEKRGGGSNVINGWVVVGRLMQTGR